MLMFYFEIYNLKQPNEPDSTRYSVVYSILNSNKELVREFSSKEKYKPGNSAVEVGGLNIITLVSGVYFLKVDVIDQYIKQAISNEAKFFVYRPGDFEKVQSDSAIKAQIAQQGINMIESEYKEMSEKEIDDEFDSAKYIVTRQEKSIYKKLDLLGKRQFMVQFWSKRDDNSDTPRNEFREDYLSKVRSANKEFSHGFKKGWKADEGRVLLTYGYPDEIERFPSSTSNLAYRIWRFFSIQGGVEFIFVDKRNMGEYELVHSTARGELYDYEWRRWIDPNR
jgi:GWxTD domain-containing protein